MPTVRTGYLGVTIDGTGSGTRLNATYPWYDATAPDLSPGAILGPPSIAPVGGPGSGPNLLEWQEAGFPFGSEQSKLTPSDDEVPGILVVQKEVRPESPPGVNPWPVGVLAEWGWAGVPLELGVFPISIGPSSHAGSAGYPGGDFEWHISLLAGCPLIVVDADLPRGYLELPYTATMAADHGVEPYVWDVPMGALPVGLSLSPEGVLSGTPGSLGSFTFTLRATDANGCPGVARVTLVIAPRARIEVDGTDRVVDIEQADFELTLNARSTARLVFGDGFVPDRGAEVVLVAQDGVTKIFGGLIMTRHVHGQAAGILANATEAHCADFSVFFDDAAVTLSYDASVAVEDVITAIVDQVLGDYGLTYTPVATGLTLAPFSWTDVIVTDALRQISEQTGLVFRTSPTKAILAIVPLANPAPVSIVDGNIHAFDLGWTDGSQLPANIVELFCGPAGPGLMGQSWVADGVETSWVTDLPAIDPPPILVEVDDGVTPRYATVVPLGEGDGAFEWDRDTHTLSLGTDTLPAAGTILRLGRSPTLPDSPFAYYTVQFPFKVRVPEGSLPAPPVTYRETRPDLIEFGPALAAAYGILARVSVERKDLEVITDEDGFLPAQALTVDTAARGGIDADFLIANVRGHIVKLNHWEYTLTAQQSDVYLGSHVEQWKALTAGSGATPATVTAPVVDTSAVVELDLSLSDVTTADVSTTKHGFAPKAPGDATKFLNGANPPAWAVPAGSGGGKVVQAVSTETAAASTTTATIPMDDSIPQITEGFEVMTKAITPTDAAHLLRIDVVALVSPDVANWVIAALFQDTTANALAAVIHYQTTGTGAAALHFTHWMTAGTTSATTFRVRIGRHTAAGTTTTFNGESGNRRMGGVMASSITITEYVP